MYNLSKELPEGLWYGAPSLVLTQDKKLLLNHGWNEEDISTFTSEDVALRPSYIKRILSNKNKKL